MCRAGREKTTRDIEFIQLNPLAEMTIELFKRAIAERRIILQAKDKYRSTAVISIVTRGSICRRGRGLTQADDFNDFATFKHVVHNYEVKT